MSTILKFPLERVQRAAHGNSNTAGNADILVFEGVRYEKIKKHKNTLKQKKSLRRKATLNT